MPRAIVIDDSGTYDVLEVVALEGKQLRVRCPYRFEIGEELRLEIEEGPGRREVVAIVRGHTADHVSELELT